MKCQRTVWALRGVRVASDQDNFSILVRIGKLDSSENDSRAFSPWGSSPVCRYYDIKVGTFLSKDAERRTGAYGCSDGRVYAPVPRGRVSGMSAVPYRGCVIGGRNPYERLEGCVTLKKKLPWGAEKAALLCPRLATKDSRGKIAKRRRKLHRKEKKRSKERKSATNERRCEMASDGKEKNQRSQLEQRWSGPGREWHRTL